jgi:hypothetical protein
MAFDLYAVQADIKEYLESEFPQYVFFRNTTPEDEQVPRDGDEVNPFFILQFGQLYSSPRGRSIKGARNDEYYSWFQVIGVGSVDADISAALSLIVDKLIGYKPDGATRLVPDGGPADYGSRQYSVRPVLYYQSQRFSFNLTQTGLDGFLAA